MKRLGRPKLVTNVYEDAIASDVANPDHINVTFNSIGGLEDTKEALQGTRDIAVSETRVVLEIEFVEASERSVVIRASWDWEGVIGQSVGERVIACFINVRTSTLQSKWFGLTKRRRSGVYFGSKITAIDHLHR